MFKNKLTKKRVLFFILIIFFLFILHFGGGILGFYSGYATAIYHRDSDAYATSLVLEKLKNHDINGAIELLETRLDNEIIQCSSSDEPYKSPYHLSWFILRQSPKQAHNNLLSLVAAYLNQYPSSSGSPDVRQKISKILSEASDSIQ